MSQGNRFRLIFCLSDGLCEIILAFGLRTRFMAMCLMIAML
jgi:hypothetical protein